MRGSLEKAAPQTFADWLALENEDWSPTFNALQNPEKNDLVEVLHLAQAGLCVYCGCQIPKDVSTRKCHIEHFRPQHACNPLALELSNLFLSCGPDGSEPHYGETCGNKKDGWFEEDCHIEPCYPGCTQEFAFSATGDVGPVNGSDSAQRMIDILNLNHPELVRERKALISEIESELNQGIERDDILGTWDATYDGLAIAFSHVVARYIEDFT